MDINKFEELKCTVCYSLFDEGSRQPRILNCGHTFCKSCLEKIVTPRSRCPKCQTGIIYNHIDTVPINYELQSLASRLRMKTGKTCKSQRKEKVDKKYSNFLSSVGLCEEHNVGKQFRCMDSCEWLCSTCIVLYHKECRTLKIADAFEEMRDNCSEIAKNTIFRKNSERTLAKRHFKVEEILNLKLRKEAKKAKLELKDKMKRFKNHSKYLKLLRKIKRDQQKEVETLTSMISKELRPFSIRDLPNGDVETLANEFQTVLEYLHNIASRPQCFSRTYKQVKEMCGEKVVYATTYKHKKTRFGRIFKEGECLWIHSFKDDLPCDINYRIPLREFLARIAGTGSADLPKRAFLQIKEDDSDVVENLVIAMDAPSPRALNFLLLCSGLKGKSYEGIKLVNSFNLVTTRCSEPLPVVKGIRDGGIYKSEIRKRYVYGISSKTEKKLAGFSFGMEDTLSNLDTKFGIVESGYEALERIRNEQHKKFTVVKCGLVIQLEPNHPLL